MDVLIVSVLVAIVALWFVAGFFVSRNTFVAFERAILFEDDKFPLSRGHRAVKVVRMAFFAIVNALALWAIYSLPMLVDQSAGAWFLVTMAAGGVGMVLGLFYTPVVYFIHCWRHPAK